jgi:hypothetical protein
MGMAATQQIQRVSTGEICHGPHDDMFPESRYGVTMKVRRKIEALMLLDDSFRSDAKGGVVNSQSRDSN